MLLQFQQFVKEKKLFSREQTILVAVSGGVDSMVLLQLLLQSGYKIAVAHCNYMLRGEESEGDAQFVHSFCQENKIVIHVAKFETERLSEQNKQSIQVTARELRYNFFQELCSRLHYDFIATAHHANDVAETILINLSRGGGMASWHGIEVKRGNIVRPLLFAQKHEIETYAKENNIQWRMDSSNLKEDYTRNLIRQQIIPVLKKINPSVVETLFHHAEIVSEAEKIILEQIERFRTVSVVTNEKKTIISISDLLKTTAPHTVLYYILQPFGFNSTNVFDIFKSLSHAESKTFYSDRFQLIKERNQLILTPFEEKKTDNFCVEIPTTGTYTIANAQIKIELFENTEDLYNGILKNNNKTTGYFDAEKALFPIVIRSWQHGDYFYPLGMHGKKLVSDFFTDEKISQSEKQKQLLFFSNNELMWLEGRRISEKFKVEKNSSGVLKISVEAIA